MQIIAPDYYKNFKCIAGECKHSCCIGWEIDIDTDTLDIYKNISGEWGQKFKKSISFDGGVPHFITDKNGRCTFLNKNGLCDIITEFGEDGLCQICYDHPRFRNYFSDRLEIGLGLCCEAATDLILKGDKDFLLIILDDNKADIPIENPMFSARDKLFDLFQQKEASIKKIMAQTAELYNISFYSSDVKSLVKIYRSLERLDPEWDDLLNTVEEKNLSYEHILFKAEEKISLPTKKLLCYFTYRYFASSENPLAAVNFVLQNTFFCLALCASCHNEPNIENFSEICRRFSLEVEYSEENVESLLKG